MSEPHARFPWIAASAAVVLVVGLGLWSGLGHTAAWRLVLRPHQDPTRLRETLRSWGIFGPLAFIGIQALQVVVAPIPGEVTGFLGGLLFGQTLGFLYSTVGLAAGSLLAFGIGRWLGARVVRRLVPPDVWDRMGFLVQAEGAIACFVIFLIPGLPKDLACYLFGLSPMPFWVFAVTSTLGRLPSTWALSAEGAKTASGNYLELVLLTALVVAVALPLYYWRARLISWVQGRS